MAIPRLTLPVTFGRQTIRIDHARSEHLNRARHAANFVTPADVGNDDPGIALCSRPITVFRFPPARQ